MSETETPPAAAQVTTDDLLDVLTLGEIAQVEELSGLSISAMSDPDRPKGKLLIAMACVAARRTRPSFTLNEAEALTGKGLNDVITAVIETARPASSAPVGGGSDPEG